MSEIERQYEYKPKLSTIVLGALFFGLCAAVLGAKANANNRGVTINGLIELDADGATTFYWVLAALSAGFVAASGALLVMRIGNPQRVALTRDSLLVPRSRWSKEEQGIDYRDIDGFSTSEVNGQRFLTIHHSTGKVNLAASMLPAKEDLDEIRKELMARIEMARKAPAKRRPKAKSKKPEAGNGESSDV